jgi:hypothetical protein
VTLRRFGVFGVVDVIAEYAMRKANIHNRYVCLFVCLFTL